MFHIGNDLLIKTIPHTSFRLRLRLLMRRTKTIHFHKCLVKTIQPTESAQWRFRRTCRVPQTEYRCYQSKVIYRNITKRERKFNTFERMDFFQCDFLLNFPDETLHLTARNPALYVQLFSIDAVRVIMTKLI